MNDSAAQTQSASVDESYRWCHKIALASKSSFYRSFWLLDDEARNSMFALYAFSRITDDLGDNEEETCKKRERLKQWRRRLQIEVADSKQGHLRALGLHLPKQITEDALSSSPQGNSNDSMWPALIDTIERYAIPVSLLEDIITGVEYDLEPVRVPDWKTLDSYCYHVASAVGLACTHIWDADPSLPRQVAIDCGIAFQLTNIARDVAEDAQRGRIYLPLAMLAQHGCSEQAWLAGHPDGNWQLAVHEVIDRAKTFYQSGWRTQDYLEGSGKTMFSLMWYSYRQLLECVQSNVNNLWSGKRVQLSNWQRCNLLAKHFLPWGTRFLPRFDQ